MGNWLAGRRVGSLQAQTVSSPKDGGLCPKASDSAVRCTDLPAFLSIFVIFEKNKYFI